MIILSDIKHGWVQVHVHVLVLGLEYIFHVLVLDV